ncbi:MAG: hypothetical protein WBV76_14750, partial [Pseudolabrys sp.]
MRTKSRFSRWLKAAAVLAVAECAGVAVVQAQSSGDFSSGDFFRFNGSHLRYDKYRGSLFDPLGWERQRRKAHRRSDGPQASPLIKAKSKSEQSEPATLKKAVGSTTGS